eukprot:COSAG01_NODE_75493_length_195_cov_115.729167_1_plen_38_part_10
MYKLLGLELLMIWELVIELLDILVRAKQLEELWQPKQK